MAADPTVLLRIWELMNLGAEDDPPCCMAVDCHHGHNRSSFLLQGRTGICDQPSCRPSVLCSKWCTQLTSAGAPRINRFWGWPLRLDKEHGLYPPEIRESSQYSTPYAWRCGGKSDLLILEQQLPGIVSICHIRSMQGLRLLRAQARGRHGSKRIRADRTQGGAMRRRLLQHKRVRPRSLQSQV